MRVVTASADKTARVWDADFGKTLAFLQAHTAQVVSVAFSPDGKRVVTGSADKTVQVWPLDPIEGNARILPLWVEACTGTEFQGGAVQGLAAEEWKTRCRQLKTAIEQGAKAPPSNGSTNSSPSHDRHRQGPPAARPSPTHSLARTE